MYPGRIISAPCKDMMYQVAMDSPVAVLKRVNVDKTKGEHCGGDDRVQPYPGASVEGNHSFDKRRKVRGPRDQVLGNRLLLLAIMFTHDPVFAAQTEVPEPLVSDHDTLEPQQFVQSERGAVRPAHSPFPARHTV